MYNILYFTFDYNIKYYIIWLGYYIIILKIYENNIKEYYIIYNV